MQRLFNLLRGKVVTILYAICIVCLFYARNFIYFLKVLRFKAARLFDLQRKTHHLFGQVVRFLFSYYALIQEPYAITCGGS